MDVVGLDGGVQAIAAGYSQTCALAIEGSVKCWGGNNIIPVDVTGLGSDVQTIATGWGHMCVITTSAGVKCWGANGDGQLGDGTTENKENPTNVVGLNSGIQAISIGGSYDASHTCALTTAGGVKCWGYNGFNQLGDGTWTNKSAPVDVTGLSGLDAIAPGFYHTCVLTTVGAVKCWGENGNGQLGDNTWSRKNTPVYVVGLGSGVSSITTGDKHTCALTTAGGIKCWGDNSSGQLGDGTTIWSRNRPVDVAGLGSGVQAITAGGGYDGHTCALTNAGGVKCWGSNVFGQLGDGMWIGKNSPVDVVGLGSGVVAIVAGDWHTCALTNGGGVKCWGRNEKGELGNSLTSNQNRPYDVTGLSSGVAAIATGSEHTCALNNAGGVKCWGWNGFGQLGDDTWEDKKTPTNVLGLGNGVAAIAIGWGHTCALTSGGGVKCWGRNYNGQLGDSTTGSRGSPVDVVGLSSGVEAIAAGVSHTCALTSGGGTKCWGNNSSGQLGDGSAWRITPVDVMVQATATPTLVPLPPNAKLLLITDAKALRAEFLDTGYRAGQDQNLNGRDDWEDLVLRLNQYMTAHNGGTVDLAAEVTVENGYSGNYAALNYGSHADRKRMGELIDELIYRKSVIERMPIENVVILGDDQVVPFYRILDPTDAYREGGSKERDYPHEVGGSLDNPALIDSGRGYILSDMPYAALGQHREESRSTLRPNLGVGRIFAAMPDELRRAIDAYERPLLLDKENAQASLFAHKDTQRDINFPAAVRRSLWPEIESWDPNQRAFYDGSVRSPWQIQTVLDALRDDEFTSIWSHANHRTIQVASEGLLDSLKYNDLLQLGQSSEARIFIGLGCNLGYSVGNFPDGTPSEHYTAALMNQFIAKGITTLAPSGYATLQIGHPQPNLNELLSARLAHHLLNNADVENVGEIWQKALPDFLALDPYGMWETDNKSTNSYHLKAAYGNALYGLPTQPIVRQNSGLQRLRQQPGRSGVQRIQPRAITSDTLRIAIDVPEFIEEQLAGGSLFSIPNGGAQIAPDFGPALPVVVRTLILPRNASNVQVTQLPGSKAKLYPGTVKLPNTGIATTNGDVITGTFTIPNTYPERLFWYTVSEQNEGLRLDLRVVPLEYSPSDRQVTVYTHLEFQVDYLLNASVGPYFDKIGLTSTEVQRGSPVEVDLTVLSAETAQLKLWWRAQGADGFPMGTKQSPLTVPGSLDLLFDIDTTTWPAGLFDLTIGLSDGNSILDTENLTLKLLGTRLQLAADTPQRIEEGQTETVLRLYAYDQDGMSLDGLANQLTVLINDVQTAAAVTEVRAGTYEVTLNTSQWGPGSYSISLSSGDDARPIATTINVAAVSYDLFLPGVRR